MNMKITRFALGAKCGFLGESNPASLQVGISPVIVSDPSPHAPTLSKLRRETTGCDELSVMAEILQISCSVRTRFTI